jgi:hypothetical protein
MEAHRTKLLDQIRNCNFDNEKLKIEYNKTLLLMAECFFKNNNLKTALQLYDILQNGHKVIKILQLQEAEIRKSKNERRIMEHLIKYMEAAQKYKRFELSIQKAE